MTLKERILNLVTTGQFANVRWFSAPRVAKFLHTDVKYTRQCLYQLEKEKKIHRRWTTGRSVFWTATDPTVLVLNALKTGPMTDMPITEHCQLFFHVVINAIRQLREDGKVNVDRDGVYSLVTNDAITEPKVPSRTSTDQKYDSDLSLETVAAYHLEQIRSGDPFDLDWHATVYARLHNAPKHDADLFEYHMERLQTQEDFMFHALALRCLAKL